MRVGCSVRLPTGVVESAPSQLESIRVVVFLDIVPLMLVDFVVFYFFQVLTSENRETLKFSQKRITLPEFLIH